MAEYIHSRQKRMNYFLILDKFKKINFHCGLESTEYFSKEKKAYLILLYRFQNSSIKLTKNI